MSAQHAVPGGLSQSRRRIAELLIDLDWSVTSAKVLNEAGEHAAALRVVEEQRDELKVFIEALAADIAAEQPRALPIRRRVLTAAAVAALALVTAIAVANTPRDASLVGQATQDLNDARMIDDPALRLRALTEIASAAAALPQDMRDVARLGARLAHEFDRTERDLRTDDDADPRMADEAARLAAEARAGRAPQPPRSISESPVETVQRELGN